MAWDLKWDWPLKKIEAAVRLAAVPALHLAGKQMVADLKRVVGVEGHGVPSDPGMPPHKQEGDLQKSISYDVDKANTAVYVVVAHPAALYLEQGTATMAPRPFLFVGLLGYAQHHMPAHFAGLLEARHLGFAIEATP